MWKSSWITFDRGSRRGLCRLCPHVVVVAELEHFSDLWGYTVERLMLDRPKVRDQTKRDTVLTPCGDRGSLPGRFCSADVTVQVNQ